MNRSLIILAIGRLAIMLTSLEADPQSRLLFTATDSLYHYGLNCSSGQVQFVIVLVRASTSTIRGVVMLLILGGPSFQNHSLPFLSQILGGAQTLLLL